MIAVIIAGTRTIGEDEAYRRILQGVRDLKLKPEDIDLIIAGGADGPDKMGEYFAEKFNIDLRVYRAKWKRHGRAAGPLRNRIMAKEGTHLIAVWDKESPGTYNMIAQAKQKGMKITIV